MSSLISPRRHTHLLHLQVLCLSEERSLIPSTFSELAYGTHTENVHLLFSVQLYGHFDCHSWGLRVRSVLGSKEAKKLCLCG